MSRGSKCIVVCIFSFWLLVSCTVSRDAMPNTLPAPEVQPTSKNLQITPQPIFTLPIPEETEINVDALSTSISTLGAPGMETDGKLRLSIRNFLPRCYKSGSYIPLTIAYENLTTKPLMIVDYNLMDTHPIGNTKAQLFPVLTTTDGAEVYTSYDVMRIDVVNPDSPLRHTLPAKSLFEVHVDYYFWEEVVGLDGQYKPTPPGDYLLRFEYVAREAGDLAWEGIISSNQITICIIN